MNYRTCSSRQLAVIALLCVSLARWAHAQTDEIQVYDAEIAGPGVFNLTWHNNYTPDGPVSPSYPGGVVPNHTLNGVTEWAYGVTDWFEAALFLWCEFRVQLEHGSLGSESKYPRNPPYYRLASGPLRRHCQSYSR